VDLYEYQGKELLRRAGLSVPRGVVATTADEAAAAAAQLGGRVAVKAQVLTGGRGKAGGIKLADGPEQARSAATAILGMDIRGHQVRKVLVEEASAIVRELYASVVYDRGAKQILCLLSPMGGMDVEQIAREHPEAMVRVQVDPLAGWQDFHGKWLAYEAGLEPGLIAPLGALFARLVDLFLRFEAMLVEVNPLILTDDGRLLPLDAKVTIDNNALFRHPDLAVLHDAEAADPHEQMARERGVTYVKLAGDIGVLGNGAGLVMSTLDVVAQAGGRPANFLDVGGGAQAEEIVAALEVITADPQVRCIFFNIFGGITRCDEVARGILEAVRQMAISLPIVARLDGTNEREGRALLAEAGLPHLHVETTMLAAARRAVALAA